MTGGEERVGSGTGLASCAWRSPLAGVRRLLALRGYVARAQRPGRCKATAHRGVPRSGGEFPGKADRLRLKWDASDAQATAEFALVLPVLLLVFLLFAQGVMVMRAQIAVTAAAREGARKAVETGNQAMIEGAAARAASGLDQDRLRVRVEGGPRRRGEWVRVEVEYDVPVAIPAVERFIPPITVRGRAEMRVENDRRES